MTRWPDMAVTKTDTSSGHGEVNNLSTSAGANGTSKTGRKPTEEEVQDALDWADGFQDRHEDLFDRLSKE